MDTHLEGKNFFFRSPECQIFSSPASVETVVLLFSALCHTFFLSIVVQFFSSIVYFTYPPPLVIITLLTVTSLNFSRYLLCTPPFVILKLLYNIKHH